MQSKAATVEQYLAELPADRRAAIERVREVILENLDSGYEEGMQYGMIGYFVPHRLYPAGYHCDPSQPLPYASLASQKNHMALYLMSVYEESEHGKWFRAAWAKTGKKLDMGKCCARFKTLDAVPLEVVAEAFRRTPAKKFIANYEAALASTRSSARAKPAKKSRPAKKSTPKAAAAKQATKAAKSLRKKKTAKKK